MNNDAFIRGFVKAASLSGLPPIQLVNIIKRAGSGMLPMLMGAVPGAAAGGYMAYDRALERKKEDPNFQGTPGGAAMAGSLLGAGTGGLLGAGAGSIGWERGMTDSSQNTEALLHALTSQYNAA
jgi:membrane protein YqaA with SNARE-associated domain